MSRSKLCLHINVHSVRHQKIIVKRAAELVWRGEFFVRISLTRVKPWNNGGIAAFEK